MTRPRKIPESQNYRQVVRGYLRLHQLTVEGRDESPDADAVRDSLDRPWRALTDVERDRVQGLSADLFAVSESTPGQPLEMNRQAQQKLAEAFEANQRGEWDRALALLRRWSKYIAPDVLSYLRAGIWSDSGSPDVAAVFYQHAATLDSDNSNYAAIHLHTLALADPLRAREMAGQIIRQPTQHSPVLVIHAADVMFGATQEMGELEAKSVFRALIPALTSALPSVAPEENPSLHAMGLATLALCHETQGDTAAALDYYTRGLRLDPFHVALLTGRGILTYGTSPQSALDLESAVLLDASLVWPYFFLAHHYLVSNRNDDARRMCERGLRMPAPPIVHSRLSEWLAVAEAELGFPPDRVRSAFEQALRLDSSNDTARQNLERFEQALSRHSPAKAWDKRSEQTVRAFGQAERRAVLAA